jgi:hypothetical protein
MIPQYCKRTIYHDRIIHQERTINREIATKFIATWQFIVTRQLIVTRKFILTAQFMVKKWQLTAEHDRNKAASVGWQLTHSTTSACAETKNPNRIRIRRIKILVTDLSELLKILIWRQNSCYLPLNVFVEYIFSKFQTLTLKNTHTNKNYYQI